MDVPGFLVARFYEQGSLRSTADGFELRAHNALGDGTLIGLGRILVDGRLVDPASVEAIPDDGSDPIRATEVTALRPIRVRKGTAVTIRVREATALSKGRHTLSVELFERDLGRLRLSITDVAG